ncbi:MAG TPA: hypothetical protein VNX01_08510 [Bacteroidia bacterium]|nr:hypothetical protein [Bacteroidia bacterium]
MTRKLFLILQAIPFFVFAQTITGSFKLVNNRHPEQESFYISSITKADMEKYRLKDKEVTLKFENGFECVLFSAKELFMNGRNINAASYEESFPAKYSLPYFNILDSGQLMAVYESERKKQTK